MLGVSGIMPSFRGERLRESEIKIKNSLFTRQCSITGYAIIQVSRCTVVQINCLLFNISVYAKLHEFIMLNGMQFAIKTPPS
jgi:hypothetical protein